MASFDPAVIAAFASGNIGRRVFLLKLELDSGTLYFTTIPNGKDYQDPLRDDQSHFYTYLGAIGSVGTVAETDDLDPAEYELIIGTADPVVLATFLNEKLINRKITCYQALINDDQSFIEDTPDAGPWPLWRGSMQPATINDGLEATITISIRDQLADWDRNITSLYTNAEQQRLHPGDLCFEHISELAARKVVWPTRELQKDQA